jgi:hypothetical protein
MFTQTKHTTNKEQARLFETTQPFSSSFPPWTFLASSTRLSVPVALAKSLQVVLEPQNLVFAEGFCILGRALG